MIIRIEMFGHLLHLEIAPLATDEQQCVPDNAPQPMVVYAETPADPVGFRLLESTRTRREAAAGPRHPVAAHLTSN